MLDGAVFAGRVHCLKDQEHSPLVLGVQFILELRESCHTRGQRFLRSWLVCLFRKFKRIVWIDILETEIFTFADAERLGESAGSFDDLSCFH